MEFRWLGRSGLRVSVLSLGTMTFGGKGAFAKTGSTDVEGACRQIDLCLDAGINLFDTADVYSAGLSEEILGQALKGRRDKVLVATKVRFPTGDGPNDAGLSRYHLIEGCEASLKRLGIGHVDLYQLHEWDGQTPLEETLEALAASSGLARSVTSGCRTSLAGT
jgi:aryl-alcohol dehydrogenase-like predicted oxidoreductase